MPAIAKAVIASAALIGLAGWQQALAQIIDPAALPFTASPLGVPGATVGTPDRAGLYMLFVRYTRGMRSPPHVHGDDRVLTVLEGTLYVAQGADAIAAGAVRPIPAGSSILIRAGTPHFGWAKDGAVLTQEVGAGPTSTTILPKAK